MLTAQFSLKRKWSRSYRVGETNKYYDMNFQPFYVFISAKIAYVFSDNT